jgi:multidrug efflux pump subunit AcrA (membrane-fusion protein)
MVAWLVILGSCLGCGSGIDRTDGSGPLAPPRVEVQVARVSRQNISETVELVGNFLPSRRTIVVSEVDGVIEKLPTPKKNPVVVEYDGGRETLPVGIGAEVKKGDLLVQLDGSDYQRSLGVAEAQLEQANRDLEKLLAWHRPEEVRRSQAVLEEAEANLEHAEKEFERHQRLIERNAVSRSDVEEKRAELRKARAILARAKAQLELDQAGPTEEEVAVARAAVAVAEAEVEHRRWKVEQSSIRAPYDAVVTDRYVSEGDRVTAMPRVEIMEIMDIRFLFAQVGVPERYGGRLKVFQPAVVRVEQLTEELPGAIVRINDKVDPATRTFRIRIAVDNSARRLRVGQFVRVLLDVQSSDDVLTVPRAAITYDGGQPHVFVVAQGSVVLTPVELGIDSDRAVEIISGLGADDQVVVDDPAVLSDGMPVRVRSVAVALAGGAEPGS